MQVELDDVVSCPLARLLECLRNLDCLGGRGRRDGPLSIHVRIEGREYSI